MDLVKEYETVLREYERILSLSERILIAIKEGMVEDTLVPLLDEKQKVADNIKKLSQSIARTDASEGSSRFDFAHRPEQIPGQTLTHIKNLLNQIRSKAESLLKIEGEIKKALEKQG